MLFKIPGLLLQQERYQLLYIFSNAGAQDDVFKLLQKGRF